MRFVLSVAFKYLIPRWRQLSVSIISLISVLVISLVVWLAVVFLSITEGIQNKWLSELLALNAPVRMIPTEAYYNSYYYNIDSLSSASGYTTKSIGDKLLSLASDPYEPAFDMQLPETFPLADRNSDGTLKDLVKESWHAASLLPGVRPQEYEVALGNIRLSMLREMPSGGYEESFLSQISYFCNYDPENKKFTQMILPPTAADLDNLFQQIPETELPRFFETVHVERVSTRDRFSKLSSAFYPMEGTLHGCALLQDGEISKVVVSNEQEALQAHYAEMGYETAPLDLLFQEGHLQTPLLAPIVFDEGIDFQATVTSASEVFLQGTVQGLSLSGSMPLHRLRIEAASFQENSPFWAYQSAIPVDGILGDGVVISKSYLTNGVRLGDRGYLSYFASTSTSQQEQRLPIYVAGFYDPGLVAIGNKFIFVDPKITTALRGSLTPADRSLGNGINIWIDDIHDAVKIKNRLKAQLDTLGIGHYWDVESYHDYEFVKPLIQQLQSDKTLFTLVSLIILLVACSNIISMLILLTNDKKKEIGIMQSMGASRLRIAAIFGLCGFITGLVSCLVGAVMAIFTVHHIESLVNVLNFFQGHEMFQAAFYGSSLPNEVSWQALLFVLVATLILSLIAGLIPALKAAAVRPTETLRSE